MVPKDRERCLIAILASRDAGLNLALHIYVGLMEGLSPMDMADIIFLGDLHGGRPPQRWSRGGDANADRALAGRERPEGMRRGAGHEGVARGLPTATPSR